MKLNEFLKMNELTLKIFVCDNGDYRVDFNPFVEIKDRIFLRSACGDSDKDIKVAINNTLKNISNHTLKIDNKRYIDVLDVEL
jgi:hypothetical protein